MTEVGEMNSGDLWLSARGRAVSAEVLVIDDLQRSCCSYISPLHTNATLLGPATYAVIRPPCIGGLELTNPLFSGFKRAFLHSFSEASILLFPLHVLSGA